MLIRSSTRKHQLSFEQFEDRRLLASLDPSLLLDLNQTIEPTSNRQVVQIGGTTLLVASDETTGTELHTPDLATGEAALWKDLNPGPASSNPTNIRVSPDGSFGLFNGEYEGRNAIWFTDGDAASPVLFGNGNLRIHSISNAGAYLTSPQPDASEAFADVTDLWFVDRSTHGTTFLRTFYATNGEGGLNSRAIRSDGVLLFEHCVGDERDCSVWGSDGTFQNTQRLLGGGLSDGAFQTIDDELFYFDDDSEAFRYDGAAQLAAVDDPRPEFPSISNQYGTLAVVDKRVVLTNLADETWFTLESDRPPRFSQADDVFVATVVVEGTAEVWAFDTAVETAQRLQGFDESFVLGFVEGPQAIYFTVLDGTTQEQTIWYMVGNETNEVATIPSGTSLDVFSLDGDLWVVKDTLGNREIDVYDSNGLVTTITGQWTRTGSSAFSAFRTSERTVLSSRDRSGGVLGTNGPLKPSLVAESGQGTFAELIVDGSPLSVAELFNVDDRVLFSAIGVSTNARGIYVADSSLGSVTQLNEVFAELDLFGGGIVLGDSMIFLNRDSNGDDSLWRTDGTVVGTSKFYSDDEIAGAHTWTVANGAVYIPLSFDDETAIFTDGFTGTMPIPLRDIPGETLSFVVDEFTYTFDVENRIWEYSSEATGTSRLFGGADDFQGVEAVRVGNDVFFTAFGDGKNRLYRISPGYQIGGRITAPLIQLYSPLEISGRQLAYAGDNQLIVSYDDGQHGIEPWLVPIYHDLNFTTGLSTEVSCRSAIFLQDNIRSGPTRARPIFDVNADGLVNASDLDTWAERLGAHGDVNLDGQVNAVDLNTIGRNWQQSVDLGWCDGDFNGDRFVDSADLNEVAKNWPSGLEAPMASRAQLAQPARNATQASKAQIVKGAIMANDIAFSTDDFSHRSQVHQRRDVGARDRRMNLQDGVVSHAALDAVMSGERLSKNFSRTAIASLSPRWRLT